MADSSFSSSLALSNEFLRNFYQDVEAALEMSNTWAEELQRPSNSGITLGGAFGVIGSKNVSFSSTVTLG